MLTALTYRKLCIWKTLSSQLFCGVTYLTWFAMAVFISTQSLAADETTTRPNVLLIMADDQGWGETGYNGHPQLKTPVLDDMAKRGLRFNRFYSAHVNCSPTRTSILTGRHPVRSGVFGPNWSTRPEEITIAQILKSAGYRTGHFGKWHVGAVKAESPTNPGRMGFDQYLSHDNFFELNPVLSRNGAKPEQFTGESSHIIADAAMQFMRKATEDKRPFFTVVWFGSPHSPYSGLPGDVAEYASVANESLRNRLTEISALDRAVGKLRDGLTQLNVRDNTLVWYCSDNGLGHDPKQSFNGPWREKKGSIYEGGVRVPGIIEWPKVIQSPRQTDMACVTSDIFPTLLELLALKSPDPTRPIDGISLKKLIEGDEMKSRPKPIGFWKYNSAGEQKNERWMPEEMTRGTTPTVNNPAIDFLNFRHPVAKTDNFDGDAAWTTQQYKLVSIGKGKQRRLELYDLNADPSESNDLASEKPDVVKQLQAELLQWQQSVEKSLSGADYHVADNRLSETVKPDPRWTAQGERDAKQDRRNIPYDGVTPNKMVCDTTLRQLPDGSWILFILAGGDTEPSPLNYVGVTRSQDQGQTWTKLERFDVGFPREGKTIGQGPTELMILGNRSTLFFSTHSKHWANDWRSWYLQSDDSFKTWSKPFEVPGRLRNRTFMRKHIVCKDGRIMVPFQHYIGPENQQDLEPLVRDFTNPRNGVLISRDNGVTWTEHGNIRISPNDRYFGWAENDLFEHPDGRVTMLIRGDKLGGVLYRADSPDGMSWPEYATLTAIPNPGSKATLYNLGDNRVALLHNPNSQHRSPMALWISFDGMKSWPYQRVLQAESVDGPKGRMNYPDGFVSADGEWLHFAFDDNRHRAVQYSAKLPPKSLPTQP